MFKSLIICYIVVLCLPFAACKSSKDDADWDIAALDLAKNVNYLSQAEKELILEMNKVRTDPKKYAQLYIQPELQYYEGNSYQKPGQIPFVTREGKKAVEDCIAALSKMAKVPALSPELGLSKAAKDHADDQGQTGQTGHTGSDGSSFVDRIQKYGKGFSYAGENIAYGHHEAREIVVSFLIDDGVPSRGHRENILNAHFTQAGVAIGVHTTFDHLCVIVLANDYTSN